MEKELLPRQKIFLDFELQSYINGVNDDCQNSHINLPIRLSPVYTLKKFMEANGISFFYGEGSGKKECKRMYENKIYPFTDC